MGEPFDNTKAIAPVGVVCDFFSDITIPPPEGGEGATRGNDERFATDVANVWQIANRDRDERRSPADLSNPWPIAERVEAVIRVFVNPEPYAKRLARRLMAKPKLARRLTRPQRATPRPGLGDWALGHASALAETAAGYFDTS